MLNMHQLSDLDGTIVDLQRRTVMLDTAIDVQVVLQLLVEKGIVSREEVDKKRSIVRSQPKYQSTFNSLVEETAECAAYKKDPQAILKRMMELKMKGE